MIRLRPGRALRLAPRWDEAPAGVVFDAASGDYWVVDEPGRALVQSLLDDDGRAAERARAVTPDALDALVAAGLLQR